MYMSLNDLREKFITDLPFAVQFVADAANVGVNVDILNDTGAQVDVELDNKGNIIGGKLYDDINLLNTYIKVIKKITETDGAIGKARLYDYLHAPFNEPDFTIDTNTREISIPTAFNRNGVGVVGDHLAEILFFKLPRFFDVVDLLDCTNINIYWCNNSVKNTENKYHLSTPVVKYAVGDILHLGWAISENASAVAGTIEFFMEFEHVNDNGQVDFRLETQSNKITIKPTLLLDKDAVQLDNYNDIIYSRAIYSPIINSLTAAPAQITTNLEEGTINFDTDNEVAILSVDAISPDNGRLVYHWNWNGIMVDLPNGDLINSDTLSNAITYNLVNTKNINFSHAAEATYRIAILNDNDNPAELNKYIENDGKYVLTTDTEVNNNTVYYDEIPATNTTYRTLRTNVPGAYQVYIGNENDLGGIRYVYSATTIIEPVSKISIDNSHLPGLAYLDWDSSNLSIDVLNANGNITYQWYHAIENGEDLLINGATNSTYDPSNGNVLISDASKRGYYYCIATNTKNNTKEYATSNRVMIESKPIALTADEVTFVQDSMNSDNFIVTINQPQDYMAYQIYATVLAQVSEGNKLVTKSYDVKNASKIFTGDSTTFSIAPVTQMYNGQHYDIDCYIVPIAQYGTMYLRYAETVDENNLIIPNYLRKTITDLTK